MPRIRAALAILLLATSNVRADPVEFNRDVRPILAENCYLCHGPDQNRRKKGLRLDDRDSAIKKRAVVPGKPAESELIRRVFADDASERMPPEETHKRLTDEQKETLKRWIAAGAEYQLHWAYIVPKRPPVPVISNPKSAIRNPIDAFLIARLEKEGIAPSPEADRRTLLRRLSLDLIGLPPTPDELKAFLADDDPRAYEKQVERLLASPHFGERMAVPWLDLVRFADTVGYHGDQNQNVFPYRDYVIDSFNRNKRFDQFTREQLAGDLLPDATTETRVASAFNRLNMMTREGGAQPDEYLAKYAADRVRTVSIAWLGSTMGCAECHDHKFDPFTQRDFYSLAAFFADIRQWGVYQDYDYTPNPDLKKWSNDHPFPPEIEVESPYLKRRMLRLIDEMERIGDEARRRWTETAAGREAFETWVTAAREFITRHDDGWWVAPVAPPGADAALEPDGSVLLTGPPEKNREVRFALKPGAGWVAAVRLELLPHEAHKNRILRTSAESTTVTAAFAVKRADGQESKVGVFFADSDGAEPRYANGQSILGVHGGWRTAAHRTGKPQMAVYCLDQPQRLEAGDELVVTLKSDGVGCVRLGVSPFVSTLAPRVEIDSQLWLALTLSDSEYARALAGAPSKRSREAVLGHAYLMGTAADRPAFAAIRSRLRDYLQCRRGVALCLVTETQPPRVTRILPRGNWQDLSGPIVEPATPAFLNRTPAAHAPGSERRSRLDLANWLTAAENPLTARVFVNRLWKQFFGIGISAVMEDVGALGDWPAHPELLDWLAVEFRENGWDVKHMIRLMVTSAAYRQSSRARPELRDRDPNNRLVAFQLPRRLEAEFIRDSALAVAGLLNREIGGPSAKPYQPAGYYSQLQFPDRNYVPHADERQYRRGVYTHRQRTFLHPMLANFDAPPRDEGCANRTVANTPQQALTLLNDPTFVECARVLANQLLTQAGGDRERLELLYERALSRPPKPAEIETLLALLDQERKHYRTTSTDAGKLLKVGNAPRPSEIELSEHAAWTEVCRAVLNLHEFITRY